MIFPRSIITVVFICALAGVPPALAQEHPASAQPPQQQSPVPQGAQPAHPESAAPHAGEAAEHAEGGIVSIVARLLNFAILAGVLVYFLRSPIAAYLASRSSQIRQDLVTAAEMRALATSQLAEIDRRMQGLPAELEMLRRQGAEDVTAEQARIAQAAAGERTRLLEQTRREIEMRLRIARRELTEHAAQLAVGVAEQRIRRTITPEDQMRLVDRYASQLKEAR
jgi:F-type H+-transporting ATPase subunit b